MSKKKSKKGTKKIFEIMEIEGSSSMHVYNVYHRKYKKKDIFSQDEKYTLKTTAKDIYTDSHKDFKLITLVDNGNGIVLDGVQYDYDEAYELFLILDSYRLHDKTAFPKVEMKHYG